MIYKLNSNKKHKHDYERIVEYYYKKIFAKKRLKIRKYRRRYYLKLVKYICRLNIKIRKIEEAKPLLCQLNSYEFKKFFLNSSSIYDLVSKLPLLLKQYHNKF